ncbi:peptide deformylase [Rapidithrix thailandica]|uniref:Peptide deformylase n=1 Tax=Rapidithrix thailandica TaxID=413964 RepID=A0AAW9S7A6_9BACT
MKLPIYSYGHEVLRAKCEEVTQDFPEFDALVEAMWETLYGANGCGLAAPQIGKSLRLFLVDSKSTYEYMTERDRKELFEEGDTGIMETFINARILHRSEEAWMDEEGCLSIPGLSRMVERPWEIEIEYFDREFNQHTKTFAGVTARMIQHEFDHTEGILYLDYLSPLQKKLLNGKLNKIAKGKFPTKYPMKFLK